jgi:hypothetical protein
VGTVFQSHHLEVFEAQSNLNVWLGMTKSLIFYCVLFNLLIVKTGVVSKNERTNDVLNLPQLIDHWESADFARPKRVKMSVGLEKDETWREIWLEGECGLDNSRRLEGRRIVGWNKQYWFELSSSPTEPSSWVLNGIGKLPMPEKLKEYRELWIIPEIEETIRFSGYKLGDFFRHPAVILKNIERDSIDADLIKVNFSIDPTKANLGERPIQVKSGTVEFSESRAFLMTGYQVELPRGKYQVSFSDILIEGRLSSIPEVIERRVGDELFIQKNELCFKSINLDEFRVNSFGIVEPPGLFVESKWTVFRTILVALLLVVMMALLFRHFKGRS